MKTFFTGLQTVLVFFGVTAHAAVWQPSAPQQQIPLWPAQKMPNRLANVKPESIKQGDLLIAGKPVQIIYDVSQPTMTIYSPKANNTGAAVVVFPGGGFHGLAIDLEGTEIAEWFASQGITGVVLKYRVPNSGPHWSEACHCEVEPYAPVALQDAQRAIGLLRSNASKWNINPNKIGVIGFSAGGFMVADVSTHFKKRAYAPLDAADEVSTRPNFAIALYPGHMKRKDKAFILNPRIQFTKETPPTFIVQAQDDPMDTIDYSLIYYIGLKKAGASADMHLYSKGGHAFGLRRTALPITNWPTLILPWLRSINIV